MHGPHTALQDRAGLYKNPCPEASPREQPSHRTLELCSDATSSSSISSSTPLRSHSTPRSHSCDANSEARIPNECGSHAVLVAANPAAQAPTHHPSTENDCKGVEGLNDCIFNNVSFSFFNPMCCRIA